MSQHDLDIANQGFPATRADINNALQALGSLSAGATAPSTTYAYQLWYDTTNDIIKIRNGDNDAWISLFTLDQTNDNIESLTVDQINADNIRIDGNTISSTDTNGNLNLDPNGTGLVVVASGHELGTEKISYTDGTDAITIDSAGHVATPNTKKSIFRARRTGNQTINNNTTTVIQFDAEDFDPDGCYNTTTYRWTPAKAGYYHIEANVDITYDNNEDITTATVIRKNGSTELLFTRSFDVGSGSDNSFHLSGVVYSDGDDYFDVTHYHYDYTNLSSATVKGASYSRTWFSGHLIKEA